MYKRGFISSTCSCPTFQPLTIMCVCACFFFTCSLVAPIPVFVLFQMLPIRPEEAGNGVSARDGESARVQDAQQAGAYYNRAIVFHCLVYLEACRTQ